MLILSHDVEDVYVDGALASAIPAESITSPADPWGRGRVTKNTAMRDRKPRPTRAYKVNTKETKAMHAYRARYARLIRRMPKRLQATMFAHILCTDVTTSTYRYPKEKMAAYSADETLRKRYKMPVGTVTTIKRRNLDLIAEGYLTREVFHDAEWDSSGVLRHRQVNRYVVNTMALDLLEIGESGPISGPISGPTSSPYSVAKATCDIDPKGSGISSNDSSSGPGPAGQAPLHDDDRGTYPDNPNDSAKDEGPQASATTRGGKSTQGQSSRGGQRVAQGEGSRRGVKAQGPARGQGSVARGRKGAAQHPRQGRLAHDPVACGGREECHR